MRCANSPEGVGAAHEIEDGGRRIDMALAVNWGDEDLRETHSKTVTFCSFACLSEWAKAKADEHDGRVVAEGA